MLFIILAAIAVLFTAVCLLLAPGAPKEPTNSRDPEMTRGGYIAGAVTGVLALLVLTAMFSMTIVSARTVGIYTEFGKEQGSKPAGIGWTSPWVSKAQEFPTNIQYLQLNKSDDGKDSTTPVAVSYKGGGKGEVDLTVRWTLDSSKALDLWRKYREFDKVTDQLVTSTARDSVGAVVGAYTPQDARNGEKRRTITDDVAADLNRTLADDGIKIDSVSITDVRLDDKTQQSIEAIIKANADIERAQAEQERAKIDAETAKIREQAGSLSAGALSRYCLELTNSWNDDNNGQLPATWTCFPGSQSTGVLVNR